MVVEGCRVWGFRFQGLGFRGRGGSYFGLGVCRIYTGFDTLYAVK